MEPFIASVVSLILIFVVALSVRLLLLFRALKERDRLLANYTTACTASILALRDKVNMLIEKQPKILDHSPTFGVLWSRAYAGPLLTDDQRNQFFQAANKLVGEGLPVEEIRSRLDELVDSWTKENMYMEPRVSDQPGR